MVGDREEVERTIRNLKMQERAVLADYHRIQGALRVWLDIRQAMERQELDQEDAQGLESSRPVEEP